MHTSSCPSLPLLQLTWLVMRRSSLTMMCEYCNLVKLVLVMLRAETSPEVIGLGSNNSTAVITVLKRKRKTQENRKAVFGVGAIYACRSLKLTRRYTTQYYEGVKISVE
ncbi:hypothetical protein Y032_0290g1528 [Ancylostoma ceylanicum]|nr:hypothetical protein Y032_0290g1528 [Ancylostoma ceylanicum]